MSIFIGLAYAVVEKEGIDTSKMSPSEVVKKYNELQKKAGQTDATPKEYEKLKQQKKFIPNSQTIKKYEIKKDELEWYDYKTDDVEWILEGQVPKRKGGMFDTNTLGGYSKYDKQLADKNNIQMMTPNEYFEKCAQGFKKDTSELIDRVGKDKGSINHLFNVVFIKNKKFPMPFLDKKDYTNQEGMHRMWIAGKVSGWDTPQPVLRVKRNEK